jgi:Fe-coproporphyrin III synthase
MSGGEALLNRNFFLFCDILNNAGMKITLLSTGMTIAHHAEKIVKSVDDVIVSLDGDEELHDRIRNIPGAFAELKKGVQALKELNPAFKVAGRSVIHRFNYENWDKIILAAKDAGLDSISFLPADVTSQAFNRNEVWEKERQDDLLIAKEELPRLMDKINQLESKFNEEFEMHYIVESREKIRKIHQYYGAHHGLNPFPSKLCNAPWVSAVIEADGSVRPCFFHDALGSIKTDSLHEILNSESSISYRKNLNTQTNPTCEKCVCSLNLAPLNKHY